MDVVVVAVVMAVGMLVEHRLMEMIVRMFLDQKQCDTDKKKWGRERIHHREPFAKNDDRQGYAEEWGAREQYLGPRSADRLGGAYIQNDTRTVRQRTHRQSEY